MSERVSDEDLAMYAQWSADSGIATYTDVGSMARELIALRAALAVEPVAWIAVSNRLPLATLGEDGKQPIISDDVLVLFDGGDCRYDIANYDHEEKWWTLPNKDFCEVDVEPTHWIPLPKLPGNGTTPTERKPSAEDGK